MPEENERISVEKQDLKNLLVLAIVGLDLMTRRSDRMSSAILLSAYGVPFGEEIEALIERHMDLFPDDFHSREEADRRIEEAQQRAHVLTVGHVLE